MDSILLFENLGWLPFLLPIAYLYAYVWLRAFGKLRVSAEACHAGGIVLGKWVAVPALAVFGMFEPAMRAESYARRRAGRRKTAFEPPVRDVAVELVPLA